MLTKRIIPCLDIDNGRVVKGVSFLELKDAGDPVELAYFYDQEGADELIFLDITASSSKRNIMEEVVKNVAQEIFIPFTVGGGIRSNEDIRRMLTAGADKVSINTAAIENPDIVSQGASHFGNQCIVVAIDAKRISSKAPQQSHASGALELDRESRWEVYINGGRSPTGLDAIKWAIRAGELGAGEILLTSMDRDGHQDGYDLELTAAISEAVSVPIIASGGAGTLDHLHEAINIGKADAVLAASIFHYGKYRMKDAKNYLSGKGIPIRPL